MQKYSFSNLHQIWKAYSHRLLFGVGQWCALFIFHIFSIVRWYRSLQAKQNRKTSKKTFWHTSIMKHGSEQHCHVRVINARINERLGGKKGGEKKGAMSLVTSCPRGRTGAVQPVKLGKGNHEYRYFTVSLHWRCSWISFIQRTIDEKEWHTYCWKSERQTSTPESYIGKGQMKLL